MQKNFISYTNHLHISYKLIFRTQKTQKISMHDYPSNHALRFEIRTFNQKAMTQIRTGSPGKITTSVVIAASTGVAVGGFGATALATLV
jgi:hypothetical protein